VKEALQVMDLQLDRLWGVADVAAFFGRTHEHTVSVRHQGYGPKARRVGRYIRYDSKEVRRWFQELDRGVM
jgi:hypothetical protein